MNKVVSLQAVREKLKTDQIDRVKEFEAKLLKMDKLELLEEMIQFQEERSNAGTLTRELIERGQILFRMLETQAETAELRELARSYRRHLKYELEVSSIKRTY